jgi:hypothetical protein
MDRIEVTGDFRVRFIGQRRAEVSGTLGHGEFIAVVGEGGEPPLRSTITLNVHDYRIVLAIISLGVH